ncbi:MAG: molybdopterin cofactor-binding domain-containing protein [Gammaproteobacteria bacterium]
MSKLVNLSLTRRQFLGAGLAGASVFLLGMTLPFGRLVSGDDEPEAINAFIGIDDNGRVLFQNPFIEMGQGTYTSIPAIMAEELDVDMAAVDIVQAPHGPDYRIMFNNTTRFTGGSFSVRSSFMTMRKAGATARAMLIRAAAGEWGVAPEECMTEPGFVVHKTSGNKLDYGRLAPLAAKLEPPQDVPLKDPDTFRLIGKPVKRTDGLAKAVGRAEFGIDIKVEDMLHAAVKQCPVFGGSAKSFDNSAVMAMPGVVAVEAIPNGVAVVAEHWWQAKKALDRLPVVFDEGSNAEFSSDAYLEKLKEALNDRGVTAENVGDAEAALTTAAKRIEADYHAPFLAHQTMEPMNCTALVTEERCKVWAPNQSADFVANAAAKITGLDLSAIEVVTPFLGGGFGRRFIMDYVEQAVTLAKKLPGKPIKVIWSREEDTQHDHYRPMTAARYRAGFDADGRPVAIHVTTAGEGPTGRLNPSILKNPHLDESIFEGSAHQPYAIPNKRSDVVKISVAPVPIGYWRSVGNSQNCFFKESFVDEMAHAVGKDPLEFRRMLLSGAPRFRTSPHLPSATRPRCSTPAC